MSDRHRERDRLLLDPGTVMHGRYKVITEVGDGTYSNVYRCVDLTKPDSQVVIKCCRNKRSFMEAAEAEEKVLAKLMRLDYKHEHFVRYHGSFLYKGHVCFIFERLGPCLFAALQNNRYRPFTVDATRHIMYQIVSAVDLLHRNRLIHTDLKLENILLVGGLIDSNGCEISTGKRQAEVRLIDFGSLDNGTSWHYHLVTTRHYRAPEVLMNLKWGYECDIWSLGCILVELAVGSIVFDARDVVHHLYAIQQVIGPIPKRMWYDCPLEELREFSRDGYMCSDMVDREIRERVGRKARLDRLLDFDRDLCDLASLMLNPDPDKRPRTDQILKHRFFRGMRRE